MAMTVAEARSEIKSHFEKARLIEEKYPDPDKMPDEELNELKRLLTEIDGMEAKLVGLEDAEERKTRILRGIEQYNRPAPDAFRPGMQPGDVEKKRMVSPGEQFINAREYRELKINGAFNSHLNRINFSVNMDDGTSLIRWKTLLFGSGASSGGAFVQNDLRPGYLELLQRQLNILDLIPRLQTSSDTVEYVREDTFTNNAALVAEATATTGTTGLKPESALAYSTQTTAVKTLAHWIPVTNRMLADAPAIAGIVNGRLLLGLNLTLETQVIAGDGTGENFTGILGTSGINISALGSDNVMDAIFKGRTSIRLAEGNPSAVVMHPTNWESVRLARENVATATLGQYLMGPPSQTGPSTVWGIPVVESQALTVNNVLVGDFGMGVSIFDREQAAVRVGTIDDQFVRNMQTILAELRAAFVVWRPAMFSRISGLS